MWRPASRDASFHLSSREFEMIDTSFKIKEVPSQSMQPALNKPGPRNVQEDVGEKPALLGYETEDAKDTVVQDLEKVASEMEIMLKRLNTELRLEVDPETRTVVVKVLDSETEDVIRQIPPEEFMRLSKRMKELIGVLFETET